jgi:hypothetical protein
MARYTFFLAYQAELERLHPGLGRHAQAAADVDGDGIVDGADRDADADGARGDADRTPLGWGIPAAFRVRTSVAVPATAYRHGYCVWLTEAIPSPTSIAGARSIRARAAERGCAPPGTTLATTTAKKPLTLRKAKIKAKSATLDGRTLKLSITTKKTARFRFEIVTGSQVVARAKPRKIKGAKKPKPKTITASLDRAPTGDTLKLRITARLGKKTARGQVRLKVITPSGPPDPPGPPGPPTPTPPAPPAPPCTPGADTDGDTIPDCQEREGFTFTYYLPAAQCTGIGNAFSCLSARSRKATSDPTKANTDGDAVLVDGATFALNDADEWVFNLTGGLSDPSTKDSDQDGLSDVEEIYRWGTSPASPDDDGDSGDPDTPGVPPNPGLFDKQEIVGGVVAGSRKPTSPSSPDSDGDGLGDLEEILNGTVSAVIADVPTLAIQPTGSFLVTLPTRTTASDTYTLSESSSSGTDTSDERVDETVTKDRHQFTAELEGSVEKGEDGKADPSATLKVGYEGEWATEKTVGRTVEFSTETRAATSREFAKSTEQDFDPFGQISQTFLVKNNDTNFSLRLQTFEVTASFLCVPRTGPGGQVGCGSPGSTVDIPTVLTRAGGNPDLIFAPGEQKSVTVSTPSGDAGVPREVLMQLLANPSAVQFRVSNSVAYRGTETDPIDISLGDVKQSTASITIDDGEGGVQTANVATGIGRDWGAPSAEKAAPKPLPTVLSEMGVEYTTGPGFNPDTLAVDRTVLTGIDGKQSEPFTLNEKIDGAWIVLANADGFDELDFDASALTVKDTLILAYVKDEDGDGLFDRDERMLGTLDADIPRGLDYDGDTAGSNVTCTPGSDGCLSSGKYSSDWFESQVGWLAGPVGPGGPAAWRVYSDPSSCDGDADMSADGPTNHQSMCDPGSLLLNEMARSTDPNNANTDGDRDDSGAPWLDGPATVTDLSFKYDPQPLTVNPAKGPVSGTWSAGSLSGGGYTGNGVLNPGVTATTPTFTLCENASATPPIGTCAGATGYYRATWNVNSSFTTQPAGAMVRFTITADRPAGGGTETLLQSDVQPVTANRPYELYFKAGATLSNVRMSVTRLAPAGNGLVTTVLALTVAPVSETQFRVAAGTQFSPSSSFQAIAIPGRMLFDGANAAGITNSSQSAKVNASASGSGFARRTLDFPGGFFLPGLSNGGRRVDLMGSFAFSAPPGGLPAVGGDTPIASVALTAGTTPLNSNSDGLIDPSGTSLPLTEGRVYGDNAPSGGGYVNIVAKSQRGIYELKPSVFAPGNTADLRLDHVVLQRLADARKWIGTVNTAGTVTDAQDGTWSGYGFYGGASDIKTSFGDGVDADGVGYIQAASVWPSNNYVGLTIDPSGMPWAQTYPDYVPVQPRSGTDYPRWDLIMKPKGTARCDTDGGAFQNPFYIQAWVIAQGSGAITSSYLPYMDRFGQNSFVSTNLTVVRPKVESSMRATRPSTNFGYVIPPCPLGSATKHSAMGVAQAIVTQHP